MASSTRRTTVWRAARGMPRRIGPGLGALLDGLVGQVRYASAERLAQLRALRERGVLVYVHRSRSVADFLCLLQALRLHALPPAAFVGGLRVVLFQGLKALWRGRLPAGTPDDPATRAAHLLGLAAREGQASMLFLRKPLTLTTPSAGLRPGFVQALIEAQRQTRRPIYLVPQVVTFGLQPGRFSPTLGDTVFGSPEEPGLLRALLKLLTRRGRAALLVGEPLDLQRFLAEHADSPDAVLTKKIRGMLLHYLAREDRVHNGPPLKLPARLRTETLRDPELRATVRQLAERQGVPEATLWQRVRRSYDQLAARFDINIINLLDALLGLVFKKIYDGIHAPEADMRRIREALRRGPVVLVPSHRSHIDYLVLSQIMARHGLIPPHIAAGANLSFFPLGWIFRRAGAYFIRRSFRGDPLYVAVFRAYLRKLIREGFTQEFFIEGTRSRTGKSLAPKLGLLSMEVDAFFTTTQRDLIFVPISIGYEKVIEEREYERELEGAGKQKENVAGLLKATGVLRSNYGRVYVHADDAISLVGFFRAQGVDPDDHTEEERRDVVTALGSRIVRCIDAVTPVTPTALASIALLGHPGRSLPHSTLMRYAGRVIDHVRASTDGQARFSPALADLDGAMHAAMGRLLDEGLVAAASTTGEPCYSVLPGKRALLNRYKNNILHFFVPEAILATALSASTVGSKPTPRGIVMKRCAELVRLLRQEFILPRDRELPDFFAATAARSCERGYLLDQAGRLARPSEPLARGLHAFVANLLAPILEAYWITLRVVAQELGDGASRKDLIAAIREAQRQALLADEVVFEEVVSKVLASNGVACLEELGALAPDRQGDRLVWGEGWDIDRLVAAADDLSRYLPAE